MEIEKYKRRAKHNIAESTLQSRLSGMRNLEEWMGGGEPTAEDVEDWVDHLVQQYEEGEIKASSIREYFKHVGYYFEVVKGDKEQLEHIKQWLPKNDSDPGEFLEVEEWEALLDTARNYRDKAILKIMYFYARRPTEVILLNEEDIDFEENTITFNILKKTDPKIVDEMVVGGEEYKVYRATYELKEEPKEALKKYMKYKRDATETIKFKGEEVEVSPLFTTQNGRVSYSTVWGKIKEIANRAGIEKNIYPKSLRHSRATHLDWSGQSPGNIARDMLIHDPDTNVVGRYIHDRGEEDVRGVMTMGEDEE